MSSLVLVLQPFGFGASKPPSEGEMRSQRDWVGFRLFIGISPPGGRKQNAGLLRWVWTIRCQPLPLNLGCSSWGSKAGEGEKKLDWSRKIHQDYCEKYKGSPA